MILPAVVLRDHALAFLLAAPLTAKERAVAWYLLTGMSQREIADRCQVSYKTLKHHVYAVYRKLGADTRAELFQRAYPIPDEVPEVIRQGLPHQARDLLRMARKRADLAHILVKVEDE